MASLKHKNITALIPAAGKAKNKIMLNSNLPDAMTPINGKPVIGYIVEDLLARNITDIIIVLHEHDEQTGLYVTKKFGSKCNLTLVYNTQYDRGIGYSLFIALKARPDVEKIFVYLGDTIYKGALSFNTDFLVTSPYFEDSKKWCFVEGPSHNLKFIDKPLVYKQKGRILCGLYFFAHGKLFRNAIISCEKKLDKIEMRDILVKYHTHKSFKIIDAEKWYDCGNIENYYRAKVDFLKLRSFNSIVYNDTFGYVTKHSSNTKKLVDEINWYRGMPDPLKIFSPRLIDYKISKKQTHYSLEFYGYQSLADLFLFESLDPKIWNIVIERLFDIIAVFKKYRKPVPYRDFHDMYYKKVVTRLKTLEQNAYWKNLFEKPTIIVNGKTYKNIHAFLPVLEKKVKKLYAKKDIAFIHGDLCLSNILFDPASKLFKLIDPRGSFGAQILYGDTKYDIAKLRHSFVGYYDFIVSDLFHLKETDATFELTINKEPHNEEVSALFDTQLKKRGYSIEHIKLIEALLFISMIPLHSDNLNRQKSMYVRGITLLNEIM